ncbi:aspartate kinase [Jeotgalibacillus proteolyticus]|uniref:aspartate kinase n=1 Tax=Jeotgalibacillus proteolyticus TaxID=2082395 RepID=UPI001431CD5C|nr:aspartate kinase [Jeotgalibacillus proteolyticus]
MSIIVQKFGGSSLTSSSLREQAVVHVQKAVEKGKKSIVVVSAQGRFGDPYATDTLLSLIKEKGEAIIPYEQQALLLTCGEVISAVVFSHELAKAGIPCQVMTGREAQIITDDHYRHAAITKVSGDPFIKAFKEVDVVVVTGFQGVTKHGKVTTLGRGGSDTTASALACSVKADACYIYTDVEGVMSGDPTIVDEPTTLLSITYDEASHIAYQGAKVIHPNAVEWAKRYRIPLWVGPLAGNKGTWVGKQNSRHSQNVIQSISAIKKLAQIRVSAFDYDRIFQMVAQQEISIDLISIHPHEVRFTIEEKNVKYVKTLLEEQGFHPEVIEHVAKIALIGEGMKGKPGITSTIVTTLAQEKIRILQTADSHMTFWVLVDEQYADQAQKRLHEQFILPSLTTSLQE